MADKKISQLTALNAANLAPSTDVLAIVDTSATETKKIVAQDLINGVLNVASAVGIGTASPAYKLDVAESGAPTSTNTFSVARISGSDSVANDLTLLGPNTSQVRIKFGDPESATIGEVGYNHSTNSLRFVTNGAEAGVFDSSGNLGLGASPAASNYSGSYTSLLVKGNGSSKIGTVIAQSFGTTNATNIEMFASDGTNEAGLLIKGASTAMTFYTGSAPDKRMTLDASGNLGVGATSPAQKLDVDGGMKGGVIHRKGTYSAGATTPSVSGVSYLDINNSSPTSITNFTNAVEGQMLMLLFRNANTTITRNNAYLAGSVNFTSATNATLTLIYDGTSWYEVCRSTTNG